MRAPDDAEGRHEIDGVGLKGHGDGDAKIAAAAAAARPEQVGILTLAASEILRDDLHLEKLIAG